MIRLLDTAKKRLVPPKVQDIPEYAILSHRWGPAEDEITFDQINQADHKDLLSKDGYKKITECCKHARKVNLTHVWVDTCCINKSNPGELSEALNSMFHWYRNAQVCYAYLADVNHGDDPFAAGSDFRKSDWFKRGWTLQELLVPLYVVFFNNRWEEIGTKSSLQPVITDITGIPKEVILMNSGREVSVAERMSWAANRTTARVEDQAYCLMGLFGVSMPMLYGEGEKAFERLQREILKVSDDQSIFAWTGDDTSSTSGLLARSPQDFRRSNGVRRLTNLQHGVLPYSMTNRGLRITMPLKPREDSPDARMAALSCGRGGRAFVICLKKLTGAGGDTYVRTNLHEIYEEEDISTFQAEEIYVTETNPSIFKLTDWMRPESRYTFVVHRSPSPNLNSSSHSEVSWKSNTDTLELTSWCSGHAGVLLFRDGDTKGYVAICLGVHNYNVWCDIVDDSGDDFESIWRSNWNTTRRDTRWHNLDRQKLLDGKGNTKAAVAISKGLRKGERVWHVFLELGMRYSLEKLGRGCCF
ncbi:heterokaryon incompatibility protein-domain-containing protein [Aspergillus pseudotamarii]|uniref:Heterokaryon incompatibility protein-domain-containing protein n=1 Tax=Aspergillus pseudotamarii TaxID=132259 RepID=A0A5N6T3Z7_ASPPS|nr:heterokaryon incompatibility protein-domain-containing protein [Aspergillus pseudotamarii]KAE8141025.1 heterokaryon incompatibility protein-domain-containing protein [Aspergillus pseudotamarii]